MRKQRDTSTWIVLKNAMIPVPGASDSLDMSVIFLMHETFPGCPRATGNPKQMPGEAVGHWVKCKGNRKGKNHSSFIFKIDSNREVVVIYKLEEG